MSSFDIPEESSNSSPASPTNSDNMSINITPPFETGNEDGAAGPIQQNVPRTPGSAVLPDYQYNAPSERSSPYENLAESNEDYSWPGQAYLQPTSPRQTLAELLRRATGRNDLQHVESVKLCIISHITNLSPLSSLLPRLVRLDLNGSMLYSLRDLCCTLEHLTHLNVSHCGLRSFDGTGFLPSLKVLIARHNRIRSLKSLILLDMCPHLEKLELQGNPVTHFILYELTLQNSTHSLKVLDGKTRWRVEPENYLTAKATVPEIDKEEQEEKTNDLSASSLSIVNNNSAASNFDESLQMESNFDLILNLNDDPDLPSNNRRLDPETSPLAGSMLGVDRRRVYPLSRSSSTDNASNGLSLSLNEPLNRSLYNNNNKNNEKSNSSTFKRSSI